MTLCLYDTYTRSTREFVPLHPPDVGLYACGPTVYDHAHIGNLRTYLFEDVLRRVLQFDGYAVRHVVNITDVGHLTSDADTGDDKVERSAQRAGLSAWALAERYTVAFKADLRALNILEPAVWCRATEHIPEQIALIACIERQGYTYRTSDGIYLDTSRLPGYGHLARLDIDGLRAGARVEVGEKRSPTDFALWKFSPPGSQRQMEWPSPWGTGFPGWHIECTAMSARYLGTTFDIHCGGEDHIPVHHTNEIAQAQACYGTRLANYWLHGYFLQLGEARMAKSSGGFLRLAALIDRGYDPLAYRLLCLTAHYRSRLTFSWEALGGTARSLDRLRAAYRGWSSDGLPSREPATADRSFVDCFAAYVNDDLNTPRAVALTWELAKSDLSPPVKVATADVFDQVLGLDLAGWEPAQKPIPDEIAALLQRREKARAARRWQEADALRDRIRETGYEIEDTGHGPRLCKIP